MHENVDKQLCLENAKAFYKTAGLIEKISGDFHEEMLAPLVMNLNFACELFLKFLLTYYYDDYEEIKNIRHSLFDLYQKLEEKDSNLTKKISCYYENEKGSWNSLSVGELLEIEKNNFRDFRYMHENKHNLSTHSSNMNAFVHALLRVCDEHR